MFAFAYKKGTIKTLCVVFWLIKSEGHKMLKQNTFATCTPLPRDKSQLVAIKPTYVMQGEASKKGLDIYHLILAPTYACNMQCKHCYLSDQAEQLLPKEEALRLVDEFSQMVLNERGQYGGIFHVKGGEPFVVPYLWDIADKLAELKTLRFMITTNGTFAEDEVFQRLSKYNEALDGNLTVIVSLEGPTKETDAILRGTEHFEKVLSFLKGLQNNKINFHLNCVLHKQNIDYISEYIDLAKKYGATQVNFLNFVPRGRGSALYELQLPHIELYKKLQQLYENGDERTKELLSGSLPHIIHNASCGSCNLSNECVAAYQGLFYIKPDGSVFTCPNIISSEFAIGNILEQSLSVVSDNLPSLYKQIRSHSDPCICTGEKILYEKTEDIINIQSLNKLMSILKNPDSANSPMTSYCFNRNW